MSSWGASEGPVRFSSFLLLLSLHFFFFSSSVSSTTSRDEPGRVAMEESRARLSCCFRCPLLVGCRRRRLGSGQGSLWPAAPPAQQSDACF